MNYKNFNHQSNVAFSSNLFGREFNAFVQRVNLGGISLSNIELSKTSVKFFTQGDTPTYETLTLDIIIDDELYLYEEIINKFQRMTKVGQGDMRLTEFTSFINIYNEKDKSILRIQYNNCFLSNVSGLEYDASGEDTHLTLTLSIDYSYFELKRLNNKTPQDLFPDPTTMPIRKAYVRNDIEELNNG